MYTSTTHWSYPLLAIVILSACNPESANYDLHEETVTTDSLSGYERLLETYKNERLTDSTILLGFRIGMNQEDLNTHINHLKNSGKVLQYEDKLFGLIPSIEYCSRDKDSVHQFVAELHLHTDKQEGLKGIHATLFGPRFYIVPKPVKTTEGETQPNPIQQIYGEIVGDSAADAAKRNWYKPESRVSSLKFLFKEGLLKTYVTRYGNALYWDNDKTGMNNQYWLSHGKIIHLALREDYLAIAKEYFKRVKPVSKEQMAGLIYIGETYYTSVTNALNFRKAVKALAPIVENEFENALEAEKHRKEMTEKKRAEKSGI